MRATESCPCWSACYFAASAAGDKGKLFTISPMVFYVVVNLVFDSALRMQGMSRRINLGIFQPDWLATNAANEYA